MTPIPTEISQASPRAGSMSAWKLWANPILRRYCRSRLRPKSLGIWLLIVLISAGFLFSLFRSLAIYRGDMAVSDAERGPLIPLFVLQALILFFLGTGQVAGGITAEADEGVLEYQRLAPMSPLAKVFGYLFGLPVREYILFLATMPFTLWCLWRGGVQAVVALQLYGVLLTSTILYHLTGLVAGTVVRNRRRAFLISMAVIFILYTAVPQMARFGLVYFKYLTIWPVLEESLPFLLPRDAGAAVLVAQTLLGKARFFGLDFPEAVFTVLSQGVFILTGIYMLWRRWRRLESHLLSKPWAVGFFAWLQVLLLGNALPLIEPGTLFPSREFPRMAGRFAQSADWRPDASEAVSMAGIYGSFNLAMLWVLTLMITPKAEIQLRGWRRVRKLERNHLAFGSDPSTAIGWTVLMVIAGTMSWFLFAHELFDSRWFPGRNVTILALPSFALVFLTGGLGFHALLEGRGERAVGLAVILAGVVPVMAGSVLLAISDRFAASAIWLIGISPASAPVYASATMLPYPELPRDLARALPRAFWFFQAVALLITLRLIANLRRARHSIAARTELIAESPSLGGNPVPDTSQIPQEIQ